MDKHKLILPVSIFLGCTILGGFIYAAQLNKQNFIKEQLASGSINSSSPEKINKIEEPISDETTSTPEVKLGNVAIDNTNNENENENEIAETSVSPSGLKQAPLPTNPDLLKSLGIISSQEDREQKERESRRVALEACLAIANGPTSQVHIYCSEPVLAGGNPTSQTMCNEAKEKAYRDENQCYLRYPQY